VPADGVKGKTWGPSSAGGATKVRPNIVDESGQNRFSKSAPSLEKSPRTLSVAPSVMSVPELGIYQEIFYCAAKLVLFSSIFENYYKNSSVFVLL
jgi:hypothetical protein